MNKTQRNILNAAFEVLSQDFSAPLDKVADAAGVTRATLHRYYKNREVLMEATGLELVRHTHEIVDEAMTQYDNPREQLKAVIMKSASLGDRFHFLLHAMEHDNHEQHYPKFQEVEQRILGLVDAVRNKGLVNPDMPNAWIIHLYYGIMTTSWSALSEGSVAPKKVPELAWQSFSSGIFLTK